MLRLALVIMVVFLKFGAYLPAAAQIEMTKKQKRAMEARLKTIAENTKVQKMLESDNNHQQATDCLIAVMEAGHDFEKNGSLSEIAKYSQQVAMWTNVTRNLADEEGVAQVDLSANNYCDHLSGGCSEETNLKALSKDCKAKIKSARKAVKKQKAK